MALAADEVVVVLVGRGQFEELGAVFERHALEHAQALECFEVTVDRHEVRGGEFRPLTNLLRGGRTVKGQQRSKQ